MTYVCTVEDVFIDNDALTGHGPITLQTTATITHDGWPVDSHLTAVINQWEAQGTPGDGNSEADIKYVEMASLTDCMSCLPTTMDPKMWRVHVHVSPRHATQHPTLT
jgi:hypothetical protein